MAKLTLAVPCNQPHTAEVFFADNNCWPQHSSFPGNGTISKDGNAACNIAFGSYVGIAYSKSIYTWANSVPDASTSQAGDRALHCVAYYSTPEQKAGATLTHSIRGSRRWPRLPDWFRGAEPRSVRIDALFRWDGGGPG